MGLGLLLFANVLTKTGNTDEPRCKWSHSVEEYCNHSLVKERIAQIGCAASSIVF